MAKTPVNTGLEAVSGRLGEWVYRVLEGKTIIARRVKRDEPLPATEGQVHVRETFRRAAGFAKEVFKDPARKAAYLELALRRGSPGSRLFAFIVQDHTKPPVITEVKTTGYARQPGNEIRVFATDNGEVVGVNVVLKDATGAVIEQGAAVPFDGYWRYVATTVAPPGEPVTVEATATDRPGNGTVQTVVVP